MIFVSRTKTIIGGVTCFGCLLFTPMLFLTIKNERNLLYRGYLENWEFILCIFNVCVISFLPFMTITLLNAYIARAIWRSNDVRRNLTTVSSVSTESCFGFSTKSTKMLLLVSTVFLFLNLPGYMITLYDLVLRVNSSFLQQFSKFLF